LQVVKNILECSDLLIKFNFFIDQKQCGCVLLQKSGDVIKQGIRPGWKATIFPCLCHSSCWYLTSHAP